MSRVHGCEHSNHRVVALLLDLGDTLMVEESEVKDAGGTTLRADLIPGVAEALHYFREQGYGLALVADSRPDTPSNVLRQHGLYHLFDYLAISEVVGTKKPDSRIFCAALQALDIHEGDYGRVAMVGNNLERDIVGANRLGLISIFFHWNDRRRSQPLTAEEEPRYRVSSAQELVSLIDSLDNKAS
ncbi:MAG TPA: HAD family hydrolase [Anaerolineae bacterium]|nr:HAD family hydrolase [Anaerolineae bacterium]